MSDLPCPCGGEYGYGVIEVRFAAATSGEPRTLEVPQEMCSACDERVYTVADLRRIEIAYREHLRGGPASTPAPGS